MDIYIYLLLYTALNYVAVVIEAIATFKAIKYNKLFCFSDSRDQSRNFKKKILVLIRSIDFKLYLLVTRSQKRCLKSRWGPI